MSAYPLSLREQIVAALDAGMGTSAAARQFGVGRATVKRYRRHRADRGTLLPRRPTGRRPLITADQLPALAGLVQCHPGATLEQYRSLWLQTTGTRISSSTLARAIHRLGFRRRGGSQ